MLSNVFQLAGFGLIVTAIYELEGRPSAFIAAGVFCVIIGLGAEGTKLSFRKHISRALQRLGAALTVRQAAEDDEDDELDDGRYDDLFDNTGEPGGD